MQHPADRQSPTAGTMIPGLGELTYRAAVPHERSRPTASLGQFGACASTVRSECGDDAMQAATQLHTASCSLWGIPDSYATL
jgi:hypothetical protein